MVRAGDCQPLEMNFLRFENRFNRLHILALPPKHHLIGTIFSTHPNAIFKRSQDFLDLTPRCENGEHGTIFGADLLDRITPTSRGATADFRSPRACRRKRWKLAKTVTSNYIDTHPHVTQNLPGEKIAEIDCPLRFPDSHTQHVVTFPGDIRKGFLAQLPGQLINPLHRNARFWRSRNQIAKHVGILRTLSGKQRRNATLCFWHGCTERLIDLRRSCLLRKRLSIVDDDVSYLLLVGNCDRRCAVSVGIGGNNW